MAAQVLKGEKKASEMPFESITESKLYLNTKVAENLSVEISDEALERAAEIFEEIN